MVHGDSIQYYSIVGASATQRVRGALDINIEGLVYSASSEPSDPPPGSQLPRICTRTLGSLSTQPTSLREFFVQSNQRGSETSQASYDHPIYKLNLVRLFRLSLPPPVVVMIMIMVVVMVIGYQRLGYRTPFPLPSPTRP